MEKLNFAYSLNNIPTADKKKLQTAPLGKDKDIYQNVLERYLFYKQQQKSY